MVAEEGRAESSEMLPPVVEPYGRRRWQEATSEAADVEQEMVVDRSAAGAQCCCFFPERWAT